MTGFDHLTFENRDGVLVIDITTEQITGPELCHGLRDDLVFLIEEFQPKHVIINLSKVEFIGSMGLLGFVTVRRMSQLEQLFLTEMSEHIKEMFVLCKLASDEPDQPFAYRIAATTEEALEQIAG